MQKLRKLIGAILIGSQLLIIYVTETISSVVVSLVPLIERVTKVVAASTIAFQKILKLYLVILVR
jgi:hypothetical protein